MQTETNHTGTVVTSAGQQRRAIKVLSDDRSPFCPRQLKDLEILCVRRQDVTDPVDVKPLLRERSDCTGRDMVVGQIAHGLRGIRSELLRG